MMGGFAGILSTNYKGNQIDTPHFLPFISLGVAIYEDDSKSKSLLIIGEELIPDIKDKKVLIVDNHIYTGGSLQAVVKFIKKYNPKQIKTLVVFNHKLKKKLIEPDYIGKTFSSNRHLVPWSISEHHRVVYET